MSLSLLLAAGAAAAIAYVGVREHRAAQAGRRSLLDPCAAALDRSMLKHSGDGFPQLSGSHRGQGIQVDLVLDTMTIRRLPQLWLSTTMLDRNAGLPGFAILVRHCGTEFYSLITRFEHRIDAPAGFPAEVLIRGDDGAEPLLAELAETISTILADGRVKEIAVTDRGLRIVRQAAEGKRGEHLLLRQSVFENAQVSRGDFEAVLAQLHSARGLIATYRRAYAA